jgi:PGM1 C-terminal domain
MGEIIRRLISQTAADGHAFVSPVAQALPRPTAHPSVEAWPAERSSAETESTPPRARGLTRERDRSARFARLQHRLVTVAAAARDGLAARTIVVVPSRSLDRWHEPPAEAQAYEERLLSAVFELSDPNVRMTYVTSSTIAPSIVDYYLSLLAPRVRPGARRRLALISLCDRSTRPLTAKLLERPSVLEQIRRSIPPRQLSHLVPYGVTTLERDLALELGIPVYGADPRHARWGTKSGSRELFALAGIPRPLGVEHIASAAEAIDAVARLREIKPRLSELVIKLNEGVSGEGNAIIDLAGLPAPGADDERPRIGQRLATLAPEGGHVTADAYLAKLAAKGGIVEERIAGRELRSPSVQFEVTPAGHVKLLSTHDQILGGPGGQHFLGCRFPADSSYAPAIGALARRAAQRLAEMGVIGRFSIDFVVARDTDLHWEPYALELNLRVGGTTHPYQALAHLAGGVYDAETATFTTAAGARRHYVATDFLQTPELTALGRDGVLALARRTDLRFDRARRIGAVFHMLSALDELGRVGFTAIGETADQADAIYAHVQETLRLDADAREIRARAA